MAKHTQRVGFYRPHFRLTEDNDYIDPATGEIVKMPSMTKQEFQHECDINNVIKSFSTSGMFKHVSARAGQGTYADLPDELDFQQSLDQVQRARESFMTLPAKVRDRFANDPARFLSFIHDPGNKAEMVTLGLTTPPPPPIPPVRVIIDPTEGTGGDGGAPPVVGAKGPVAS